MAHRLLAMYNLEHLWDKVSLLLAELVMEDKLTRIESIYISRILGGPACQGAKSVHLFLDEEDELTLIYTDAEGVPFTEFLQYMIHEDKRARNL